MAARRAARPLSDYPGALPATLEDAYAVQDIAIALSGGRVAGWKVGRIHAPKSVRFGSNRLAGPIFAHRIVEGGAPAMPVFAGGFGAVEAEFVYRLRAADPERSCYSEEDAAAQVEGVFAGIEIASSPLTAINALGPAVTVSDFGNNNGLILGPRIDDWRSAGIDSWPVAVSIDDVLSGQGAGWEFPGGTLGSVRFLLELLARRGIAVPDGTLVSTGALSGVHQIRPGQRAAARFAGRFEMACTIIAAVADPD